MRLSLSNDGTYLLEILDDEHLEHVGPNVFGPVTTSEARELTGGGSGVLVAQGSDSEFGDIVFKHGAASDSKECFALATIHSELKRRGERAQDCAVAAAAMSERLPEFRFIYISRKHLWDRALTHWHNARNMLVAINRLSSTSGKAAARERTMELCHIPNGPRVCLANGVLKIHCEELEALSSSVSRCLWRCGRDHEGYSRLRKIFQDLVHLQKEKMWKFTLAQKQIGGDSPKTASKWLLEGRLRGDTMKALIHEIVTIMQYLETLTSEDEANGVEIVRKEVDALSKMPSPSVAHVSAITDAYVGHAIVKNFDSACGRFVFLRNVGEKLREQRLQLAPEEIVPGEYLAKVLAQGALIEDVFADAKGSTSLDLLAKSWLDLLREAVSLHECATHCMWTAGLTDSGLHNMFLDEGHIWLFDLGEPALVSRPAFLTKFLMSFYHVLGMEEMPSGRSWVTRFKCSNGRLRCTEASASLLKQAEADFSIAVQALVDITFHGQEQVRLLLARYAALQLLSDAAFCLQKWEAKGGGQLGLRPQASNMEKWLWRALWDVYVSARLC